MAPTLLFTVFLVGTVYADASGRYCNYVGLYVIGNNVWSWMVKSRRGSMY